MQDFFLQVGAGFREFNEWDLGFILIFKEMWDILFIGNITRE